LGAELRGMRRLPHLGRPDLADAHSGVSTPDTIVLIALGACSGQRGSCHFLLRIHPGANRWQRHHRRETPSPQQCYFSVPSPRNTSSKLRPAPHRPPRLAGSTGCHRRRVALTVAWKIDAQEISDGDEIIGAVHRGNARVTTSMRSADGRPPSIAPCRSCVTQGSLVPCNLEGRCLRSDCRRLFGATSREDAKQ
jgi:hypothetical protein